MMAMWTQFARTGNPNVKGLVTCPAYDSATDQYLYIADPLQVKSGNSKLAQKQ
jgi:carboxylesterase type B